MSVGQWIGGALGAVVGYIYGGPYGALYGASLGYGLGGIIDPPPAPEISKPDTADLTVPSSAEGVPIPDVIGITQISNVANVLWYTNSRNEEQTEEAEGGSGGGGSEYVTGYKYYLTFALGLLKGPATALYSIYEDNNLLWTSGTSPLTIDDATDGKASITISGRGVIDFYFGTTSQTANDLIEESTGYAYAWKGLCYVVFRDFMIGAYNRVGAMKFVIKKLPSDEFNANVAIGDYDCNPIHAIRHIIESSEIDLDFFDDTEASSVADVLYAENRGVSGLLTGENSALEYLEIILFHIRGCLRLSNDGLLQPKLFRNDTAISSMLSISEEDILEDIDVSRKTTMDLNNQINGSYMRLEEEANDS